MHKMKSLDLNLLAALDVLLGADSVSQAAQRMHLSAPAMSHTLARIREALGDPILVRAGRKLIPTARALELREPVRKLMAQARELMQPGDGLALAGIQREFVIRSPEGMGVVYGVALLAALRATMPLASLRFVPETDSDAVALREGRIDLDVGVLRELGPEIQTEVLYEQRVVGVVQAGHRLLKGRVTLKRFAAEQHVAIAQRGRSRELVDRYLAEAGCQRQIAMTIPSSYGALMVAARSQLVACAPEPLVRQVAASLGLKTIPLPVAMPTEQVVQAWHPKAHADPAHQCLRHCVTHLPTLMREASLASASQAQAGRHETLLKMGSPPSGHAVRTTSIPTNRPTKP